MCAQPKHSQCEYTRSLFGRSTCVSNQRRRNRAVLFLACGARRSEMTAPLLIWKVRDALTLRIFFTTGFAEVHTIPKDMIQEIKAAHDTFLFIYPFLFCCGWNNVEVRIIKKKKIGFQIIILGPKRLVYFAWDMSVGSRFCLESIYYNMPDIWDLS